MAPRFLTYTIPPACHHLSHRCSWQVSQNSDRSYQLGKGSVSQLAPRTNCLTEWIRNTKGCFQLIYFLVGKGIMSILWLFKIGVIYLLLFFWATLLSRTDEWLCYSLLLRRFVYNRLFLLMISMIVRYVIYLWEVILICRIILNFILLCETFHR
jgi:hypothetical protein